MVALTLLVQNNFCSCLLTYGVAPYTKTTILQSVFFFIYVFTEKQAEGKMIVLFFLVRNVTMTKSERQRRMFKFTKELHERKIHLYAFEKLINSL